MQCNTTDENISDVHPLLGFEHMFITRTSQKQDPSDDQSNFLLTCSNGCERLGRINQLTSQRTEIGLLLGMGEFLPDQAGEGLLSCAGGSYTPCSPAIRSRNHTLELSCISNDSRRCAAFTFQDEWNVSMKFLADIDNNRPTISRRFHSMPIFRATPCDTTRVVRTFSPKQPISTL